MKVKIFFITLFFALILCSSYSFATEIDIECPSAILINADNNKILYEKNANKSMYPASTTKIMTAILTIENCKLTDVATVSKNAVWSVPERPF